MFIVQVDCQFKDVKIGMASGIVIEQNARENSNLLAVMQCLQARVRHVYFALDRQLLVLLFFSQCSAA